MNVILLYLFLMSAFIPSGIRAQQKFLKTPLAGAYLKDFFIVHYMDWSVDNILDYHCGEKSYDGHQGTDFVLRNFAQMDQGVTVLAAADGIVSSMEDSLYDRNKTAISGGLGNYIFF